MSKERNQKLKLIYVLDILKKHSDEDHPLNAVDIAGKLSLYGISAERKSIYDDLNLLEQYGCDIIKATSPKKGWFIGDREFEVPEIFLLCDAVRSAKFISAKKTRELLSKLHGMLSIHQVKRNKNAVFFGAADKCGNESLYYNIDKLSMAIESSKQVRVLYSSRRFNSSGGIVKDTREMTINPYALTWQDDYYYLIGNHIKYDNLIHLRLDRIESAKVTDSPARSFSQVSEYTEFFDTADYTNKLFGMYSGELCDVELKCSNSITEQLLDRFSENAYIRKINDGEFLIRVKAVISDALVTWIINYGKNITVIKPEQLRESVKKRAAQVLENYLTGEQNLNENEKKEKP